MQESEGRHGDRVDADGDYLHPTKCGLLRHSYDSPPAITGPTAAKTSSFTENLRYLCAPTTREEGLNIGFQADTGENDYLHPDFSHRPTASVRGLVPVKDTHLANGDYLRTVDVNGTHGKPCTVPDSTDHTYLQLGGRDPPPDYMGLPSASLRHSNYNKNWQQNPGYEHSLRLSGDYETMEEKPGACPPDPPPCREGDSASVTKDFEQLSPTSPTTIVRSEPASISLQLSRQPTAGVILTRNKDGQMEASHIQVANRATASLKTQINLLMGTSCLVCICNPLFGLTALALGVFMAVRFEQETYRVKTMKKIVVVAWVFVVLAVIAGITTITALVLLL